MDEYEKTYGFIIEFVVLWSISALIMELGGFQNSIALQGHDMLEDYSS